jgi:hypothetical protein
MDLRIKIYVSDVKKLNVNVKINFILTIPINTLHRFMKERSHSNVIFVNTVAFKTFILSLKFHKIA